MYEQYKIDVVEFTEAVEFALASGSTTCETEGDNEVAFNTALGDC